MNVYFKPGLLKRVEALSKRLDRLGRRIEDVDEAVAVLDEAFALYTRSWMTHQLPSWPTRTTQRRIGQRICMPGSTRCWPAIGERAAVSQQAGTGCRRAERCE